MKRLNSLLFPLCVTVLTCLGGDVQADQNGENLSVSVFTFGPGDHPFFKFGHNAILIRQGSQPGWVYNFGTFQFDSIDLLPTFLKGRVTYWLSVASEEDAIASYTAENRTIIRQDLDLQPNDRLLLWQSLKENARPENRGYLYDYFWDNCSTRVRDAIDRITQGRIRATGKSIAPQTFRQHALRMTADFLPEYLGLYLGLGRAADIPITRWDASFLPENLQQLLREVRIQHSDGERPLVKEETTLFTARRAHHPESPPQWTLYFLFAGMVWGGVMASLGWFGRRLKICRILLGLQISLIGILFGFLGTCLVCVWAFTDHTAAHTNANILQIAPFILALGYDGIRLALGNNVAAKRALWLTLLAFVLSFIGLIAKVFPGLAQDNLPLVAFFLPLWLGTALSLFFLLPNYLRNTKANMRKRNLK
jgi:hypothetical protein